MADDPSVINISTFAKRTIPVNTSADRTIKIKTIADFPVLLQPPTGTLALNSIVIPGAPGEVLFDFTTSDTDGTVVKIELLRKETAEPDFTEVTEILSPGASGQISDTSVPAGTYEYKLLITDNDDLTGESNVVAGITITAALIVTFDVGGAKVFADNEDIPGFTAIMKARKFGGALIEQTSGGKGRIRTTVGSDTAYFVGKKDQVPKGTWEMVYDLNVSAVGGQMDVFVNDGQYSLNGAVEPATYVFGLVLFFNGQVRARFRNVVGSLVDVGGGVLTTYVIGTTGEVTCKLGKTATDFTYSFNGVTTSIPIASVKAHTQENPVLGEEFSGTTVTAEFDNIAGID